METKHQAAAALVGIVLCVSIGIAVRYQSYTFIRRDASFYATISMGLVHNLSLDQRERQPRSWYSGQHPGYANLDAYWSNVSVGRGGAWYPKHSFLISVAAAPFYALFGVDGLLLFNALCVTGMLWAAYLMAARFAGPVGAAVAVIVTALSPMLVEHTYLLSADVFNATLVATGALSLLLLRPALAGTLLGLALWARPATAPLVVPVAAALCWRQLDRRQLLRFGVALAIPLLAAAAANTLMYGAPWITSYDRILTVEDRAPRLVTARSLFTNPWADGVRLMFQNREHGLVNNALSGLVSIAGILFLWRRHRLLAVALALGVIGFLAVYLPYRYFNARFFFAWQVLLCIPLAVLIADLAAIFVRAAAAVAPAGRPRLARLRERLRGVPRWVLIAAVTAPILGGFLTSVLAGRRYVLANHLHEAKVFRNDFPCDYFNITHQAWECSRIDRSETEYPGLALRPQACRFGGAHREMVTLAPPLEGGRRRVRFERVPGGALELRYGLQEGSGAATTCFSASYGDRPPQKLCMSDPGVLHTQRLASLDAGEAHALEISVEGSGPSGLCFDGSIEARR